MGMVTNKYCIIKEEVVIILMSSIYLKSSFLEGLLHYIYFIWYNLITFDLFIQLIGGCYMCVYVLLSEFKNKRFFGIHLHLYSITPLYIIFS